MIELFDTHCHLNLPDAFPDPEAAIEEARRAGVSRLAIVGIDAESGRRALEIAEQHEHAFAIVGWHPNSAAGFDSRALESVRSMLAHPKVVALGEIGLDYHWTLANREQQYRCLMDQLDLAEDLQRPVVFHCREAYDDLLDVLESRHARPYLLHCFSGDAGHAERATRLGCTFGVDGPVTYKKSNELREILSKLPKDKIVLETDSPYMPPEPFRGRPNKPSHLPLINGAVASCLGLSPEDCALTTTGNARRFFRV